MFKKPAGSAEELKVNKEAFDKEIANLTTFIKAHGGSYLTGEHFTMADSNCFLFVATVIHNKIHDLDSFPEAKHWYELCAQQPGPKRVLQEVDAFWAAAAAKAASS